MRDLYAHDLAPQRRVSDDTPSAGDTAVDVISGLIMMLAIIAFGFNLIGFFS